MEFYKIDIKNFLYETSVMNFTQLGIYITMTHRILRTESPLPDDIQKICIECGIKKNEKNVRFLINNFFTKVASQNGFGWITGFCLKTLEVFYDNLQKKHRNLKITPKNEMSIKINEIQGWKIPGRTPAGSPVAEKNIPGREDTLLTLQPLLTLQMEPNKNNHVNIYNNNNNEKTYSGKFNVEDNSIYTRKTETKKDISSFNFLKFIEIYPKKVDQIKIQKAYYVWLSDNLEMKVDKLFTYIRDRTKTGDWEKLIEKGNDRYIPDPFTFLRDKIYEKDFERVLSIEERAKIKADEYMESIS